MQNYNVRGENIEVTKAIRGHAEKKVSKLERFFDNAPDATAMLTSRTGRAEVTIPSLFLVLRCGRTNPDLYASIDLGRVDKLNAAKANINKNSP